MIPSWSTARAVRGVDPDLFHLLIELVLRALRLSGAAFISFGHVRLPPRPSFWRADLRWFRHIRSDGTLTKRRAVQATNTW